MRMPSLRPLNPYSQPRVDAMAGPPRNRLMRLLRFLNWMVARLRNLHWSVTLILVVLFVVLLASLSQGNPRAGGGSLTFAEGLFALVAALAAVTLIARIAAVRAARNLRTPDDTDSVWRSELSVVGTADHTWQRVRSFAEHVGEVDNIDDDARCLTWCTAWWLTADRYWLQVFEVGDDSAVVAYCAGFLAGMKQPEHELHDRVQRVHDRLRTTLLD